MDFNIGSMKRKQSNSLLHALGKPSSSRASAIPIASPTSTHNSTFYSPPSSTTSTFPAYDEPESPYQQSSSSSRYRSVSTNSRLGVVEEKKPAAGVKRPEDVFRVVRDRLLSWSYLMSWYQGDVHWLNTVRISRSSLETTLGPSKLDSRSRNFYVLGASLSALFDISQAGDFLKALLKLLEEWEAFAEGGGGKGVKNLFKGQRLKRPSGAAQSDVSATMADTESFLLPVHLPFSPDFFQVHSTLCSIIQDLYRKVLGMLLPSRPYPVPPRTQGSLLHPSTIIQSAPLGDAFAQSTRGSAGDDSVDALSQLIAGELPPDRTMVGDGQAMSPAVMELFGKVDAKLRKHYSVLLREADALARKALDIALADLTVSLSSGHPLKFDLNAALTGNGMGWDGAGAYGSGHFNAVGRVSSEETDTLPIY